MLNHAPVTALLAERGTIAGATVQDATTEATANVRARSSSTPPVRGATRCDGSIRRPRRIPRRASCAAAKARTSRCRESASATDDALTLLSPTDGRVLFALPAQAHAIIGTTDTYTTRRPTTCARRTTTCDICSTRRTRSFRRQLSGDDVVSAWAGIRPLLPTAADTPGAATREHAIATSASGLVSITGGKLTTYRVMARDVVRVVLHRLRRRSGEDRTETLPLPGGDFQSLDALIADAERAIGDVALARHFVISHGTRWRDVWDEMLRDADGRAPVAPDLPYTIGELRYSVANEMAQTLGDLLIRRTHLAFETRDHGVAAAERVAAAVAPQLGWTAADSGARSRTTSRRRRAFLVQSNVGRASCR